jgi:hypothetical protein
MATAGLAKSAELEARENQTAAAIDQAKQAQEMNTLGTGAGFGAMYGMKNLGLAKEAVGAVASKASPALQTFAATSPDGGISVLKGLEGAASMAPNTLGSTTAVVGTGTAPVAAASAPPAAAASGSAMSALSTIAAPVAIGLGVAYLLNKLFD